MMNLQQHQEYLQRFGREALDVIESKEFEIDQLKICLMMHEQRITFLEQLYDRRLKQI